MKSVLIPLIVAAGVLSAGLAKAGAEVANTEMAKAQCGKCHELDKKKKGPAFQDSAKKYKGKADAEALILKTISDPKGDHPELTNKPEDIKAVIKWILTL